MLAYSELRIKRSAILENLQLFSNVSIMPMIKGNGYGLGMVSLAQWFDSLHFPFLGVAHLTEAIELREAGIQTPIFVCSFLAEQASLIIDYRLTVAVDTVDKLNALAKAASFPLPIHVKLNLGLNRFGISLSEWPHFHRLIQQYSNLYVEGIFSHLPWADSPSHDSQTLGQIEAFKHALCCLSTLPKWIHLGASAAQSRFSLPFCNLARIGLNMLNPHPAIALYSRIIAIRQLQAGESIGYCCCAVTKPTRVAILGIGYHDGLHIDYGMGKTSVICNGHKAPIIGRICMDFLFIDVTDCGHVTCGDWVELFGKQQPLSQIAQDLNINPRVLLSQLGPRIERVWEHESIRKADYAYQASEAAR